MNLSVDSALKEQAGKILENMGLTFNEAFTLLLHQVRLQKALPFEVVSYGYTPKAKTLELIERIETGKAEMAGPFNSFDEYKSWMKSDDAEI